MIFRSRVLALTLICSFSAALAQSPKSPQTSEDKQGKKPVYYGMVPKTCPKGGFPVKSELIFAGLSGLTQQTVTSVYKAPCPRKR